MKKRKKTGEKTVFFEIWAERPHKCVICDAVLPMFTVRYFAHILGKGAYPSLRLNKENIEIMCFPHHYMYDHETNRAIDDPRFDKIFIKKDKLKNGKQE